jgi:uncharacterized surface protein with fasciclin (FAS1) repeats
MANRIAHLLRLFFACGLGIMVAFALAGLDSCKKTPPAKVVLTPLQNLVNTDTTLSLFHRMLVQADETALLNDNTVTLLLPTNAAFRSAGYTEIIIDSLSNYIANNLIQYLFITSHINPDSSTYQGYPTVDGYNVFGMTDSTHHIWFNGSMVTGKDSMVGNALVYRLSSVLQGPADSLNDLLSADSTLSFFAEAFQRTNLFDSLLLTGNFTILAPNNNAFINAGYDSIGAIDSANYDSLISLLEFHIVPGFYFTNTLMGLSTIPTYSNGSIAVSVQNGILRFTGGNPVPANLLLGNQTAGNNIIVHRIDQVLSPP